MAIKNVVGVVGVPTVRLVGPDGEEKARRVCRNHLVAGGIEMLLQQVVDPSALVPSHVAIGEGTTSPETSDTDLETQAGNRKAISDKFVEMNEGSDDEPSAVFVGLFEKGESIGAITEAGLFTDTGNGFVMTNRVVFPAINKQPDDNLEISWRMYFENL